MGYKEIGEVLDDDKGLENSLDHCEGEYRFYSSLLEEDSKYRHNGICFNNSINFLRHIIRLKAIKIKRDHG